MSAESANKEWKKYYSANREASEPRRKYNVYSVGFYAGRDHQRNKKVEGVL